MTRREEYDRQHYQDSTNEAIRKTEQITEMLKILQKYEKPTWSNAHDMDGICEMLQQVIDQMELIAFFMG